MYENMYEKMIAVTNRHLVLENDTDGAYLKQLTYVASLHPKAMVLREKDLTEAEYEQLAGQVMKICKTYKVPCILHNFWQIAVKLNSNQIHLPLPVLRQLVNQAVIQEKNQGSGTFYQIGTSVHSVEEAVEAAKENAALNGLDNCTFWAGDVLKVIAGGILFGGRAYLCD